MLKPACNGNILCDETDPILLTGVSGFVADSEISRNGEMENGCSGKDGLTRARSMFVFSKDITI